ncbi:MAG: ATP-grasp domain-containing protein, partial [Deltaproteobacteria bacterium]|nr:ATP-grasp domain-containing protein [Deltaproteobacteria bacterium]
MWVIVLGINSQFKRAFHAARELGLHVFLITAENNVPDDIKNLTDSMKVVKDYEFGEIVSIIKRQLPDDQITLFWTLKDQLLPLTNKLNRYFDSPAKFYSGPLISICKNKLMLRRALEKTPYNPVFNLYVPGQKNPFSAWSGPKVIKPLLGYSSIGVEMVTSEQQVYSAIERSLSVLEKISHEVKSFDFSHEYDVCKTLLVEDYIDGEEYSVEIFANKDGIKCLGICEKSKMPPPYFEEISYCMPGRLKQSLCDGLKSAAMKIAEVLDFRSGMAHLEFKCSDNKIILLDIGLRLGGGGLTHELIHISSGIDAVKAVLAELCGMESNQYLIEKRKDIALLY